MKPFTKNEKVGIILILLAIISLSLVNFNKALMRSRDAQRREDLGALSNGLGKYHNEFGFFPLASDKGIIKACKGDNFQELVDELNMAEKFDTLAYLSGLAPCAWGKDSLRDLADDSYPPYIKTIPGDPRQEEITYLYISNANRYQIYAYLEGEVDEIGFNQGIVDRELMCGTQICNFGRAFGETPLEKSIEEYENELEEKSK